MISSRLQPMRRFDRMILSIAARLVPGTDREEWLRGWQAELWDMHHRCSERGYRKQSVNVDLSIGIVRDAFWMRQQSWVEALRGSATLCLLSLFGLSSIAAGFALLLEGSWHLLSPDLVEQFRRSLCATPLVIFVALATSLRKHTELGSTGSALVKMKRHVFFTLKATQVILLAFLLSADVCEPLRQTLPHAGDLLQLLLFVSFTLLGLRWTFSDQEQRCKQCLQSLQSPERVGRPSYNLLEWNGTELNCRRGHGLLSVPEMESSWCRASQWRVSKLE